jgi:hypothetical protein
MKLMKSTCTGLASEKKVDLTAVGYGKYFRSGLFLWSLSLHFMSWEENCRAVTNEK